MSTHKTIIEYKKYYLKHLWFSLFSNPTICILNFVSFTFFYFHNKSKSYFLCNNPFVYIPKNILQNKYPCIDYTYFLNNSMNNFVDNLHHNALMYNLKMKSHQWFMRRIKSSLYIFTYICIPSLQNGPVSPGGHVHPYFVHMYIPRHILSVFSEHSPLQLAP